MKQVSIAPILSELNNPSSLGSQAKALRNLKNEIIGHQQSKELWIRHGIVAPLARILAKQQANTPNWQDPRIRSSTRVVDDTKTSEEDLLNQAIIVTGSLAQGGPQFVSPLLANQIVAPLVQNLNPSCSAPSTILAVLRTLNTIADSAALENRQDDNKGDWALKTIYSDETLVHVAQIFDQDSSLLVVQQQISLAAALISKTCHEESSRNQLAYGGVLEALSKRIASFIVLLAEQKHHEERRHGPAPKFAIQPAASRARLAPLLQAVATIITNSSARVAQFLRSPAFASCFQHSELEGWKIAPSNPKSPIGKAFVDPGALARSPRDSNSQGTSFPPLGEMARWGKRRINKSFGTSDRTTDPSLLQDDHETPIAGWLSHILQREQGVTRLMAAWLLAIIFREGYTSQSRDKILAMQLVPLLVRMLEADEIFLTEVPPSYDDSVIQPPRWLIKRLAPQVLGLLVSEHELLQEAASDAGAIKKLSQMLKQTFDPLPQNESLPLWSPEPRPGSTNLSDNSKSFCTLGAPGLTPSAWQVLQTRASVIGAIASMATRSDEYRKAIIANGVVPYLISSLKPSSSTTDTPESEVNKTNLSENPVPVLMQACAAATALSRSVSTLRTSLIEAGLATPIFHLLHHPDVQVQIAATGAVCNIVLEFSPVRQLDIIDAGVLTTLCKHAHSPNLQLRLNSFWALKHLVHSANNQLKVSCVEELGAGWLKQIICNEADGRGGSTPLAMGTSNAAGEQVDLLNAVDSHASLAISTDEIDHEEVHMVDSIGNLSQQTPSTSHERDSRCTTMVHGEEEDSLTRTHRHNVLVQEQALDLVRNLLGGTGSPEMIDYVFQELGEESLFTIFTNLLCSRPTSPMPLAAPGSTRASGPPHPEIVLAVIFILVHIATGYPRHRQQLLAHTELMRVFVPLAEHRSPQVRVAYALFVINLTWVDDTDDKLGSRARAHELRKLGIEERLEALQRDSDLDVRERAKQATASLHDLLKGGAA